jgi:hypothetical protein
MEEEEPACVMLAPVLRVSMHICICQSRTGLPVNCRCITDASSTLLFPRQRGRVVAFFG